MGMVLQDEQGYYANPALFYTRTGEPVPRIPLYRIRGTDQFTDTPDVIRNSSLHRGSDAQGLMDAAEIVPSKIQSDSSL